MENSYAGFEEGIKDMKAGGKRRIIIPPELGPPVSVASLVSFLCFGFTFCDFFCNDFWPSLHILSLKLYLDFRL